LGSSFLFSRHFSIKCQNNGAATAFDRLHQAFRLDHARARCFATISRERAGQAEPNGLFEVVSAHQDVEEFVAVLKRMAPMPPAFAPWSIGGGRCHRGVGRYQLGLRLLSTVSSVAIAIRRLIDHLSIRRSSAQAGAGRVFWSTTHHASNACIAEAGN
jgi:hypothetical protein